MQASYAQEWPAQNPDGAYASMIRKLLPTESQLSTAGGMRAAGAPAASQANFRAQVLTHPRAIADTIGSIVGTLGSIPCCFCCPNPYKSVQQGSVGLVTKFGQLQRSVDPGLVKLNPLSENLKVVDVKVQIAEIPRQTVMTRDNVSVLIDSVLVYHIDQPARAAFGVSDVKAALVERAQTTLRHVVGSRTLQSTLTDREAVAAEIEGVSDRATESLAELR